MRSCRPIVHHLCYLLPNVIGSNHSHPILFLCDLSSSYCCLCNTCNLASQPFTYTTLASKIWILCIRAIMAENKKSLVWEWSIFVCMAGNDAHILICCQVQTNLSARLVSVHSLSSTSMLSVPILMILATNILLLRLWKHLWLGVHLYVRR